MCSSVSLVTVNLQYFSTVGTGSSWRTQWWCGIKEFADSKRHLLSVSLRDRQTGGDGRLPVLHRLCVCVRSTLSTVTCCPCIARQRAGRQVRHERRDGWRPAQTRQSWGDIMYAPILDQLEGSAIEPPWRFEIKCTPHVWCGYCTAPSLPKTHCR